MKISTALAALAGLLLAIVLIAQHGLGAITQAVLTIGWGLVGVAAFHLVPMTFSALAWHSLLTAPWRRPVAVLLAARWIREAANNLLPMSLVGGELVGARILTFYGVPAGMACATIVVDLTMETVTQFLFTMLGLALLVAGGNGGSAAYWVVVGLLIAAPALAGFVAVQRNGLFARLEGLLARVAQRYGWRWLQRIAGLDEAVQAQYQNRRSLSLSCVFHLWSWVIGAGEVWMALRLMGIPFGFREALILESLGQAVRSAAFAVPGALGVQEGGFMLLGGMFGLTPESGLALSLVKRVRELVTGLPALVAWQIMEGRRLWVAIGRPLENADESGAQP